MLKISLLGSAQDVASSGFGAQVRGVYCVRADRPNKCQPFPMGAQATGLVTGPNAQGVWPKGLDKEVVAKQAPTPACAEPTPHTRGVAMGGVALDFKV